MREDILARGDNPELFPILNSKPEMYQDLLWIWEGFMILSPSRQIGMNGPQPIAIADIAAYCSLSEIYDTIDRDDFLYHVQRMDLVFMRLWRERQPKDGKTHTKSGTPEHLG